MSKVHDYMHATGLTFEAARRELMEQEEAERIRSREALLDAELDGCTTVEDITEFLKMHLTPTLAKQEPA